jgi:hypothetical protein
VTKYLLDHQWIFDARYNLNRTTALLTGFNVDVKNPFKSLRPGHRLVFLCPCFFIVGMLVLYNVNIRALAVEKLISPPTIFKLTEACQITPAHRLQWH